ncbi:hypothetical protein DFH29DRAFT_893961 [Suillus ampliporus]|nr:hypothetical protein DFH29DRAFT_893961 [Suillus ampliporus]
MLSLPDRLRLPTDRVPVTTQNFVSDILPPVVCYFATAFLVLLPRTQPIRIALWPVTAFLAVCAARSLDVSMGQPKVMYWEIDLQISMFCIVVRTLDWTVQTKPFIRTVQRSAKDLPKRNFVLDTLDLACNFRGCDWNWSRGLYVPPETRPTSSRLAFATSTLVSGLKHTFICGVIHSAVKSFSSHTFGSVNGGTIFDDSLPPHIRYLRSSIITTLCAFAVCLLLQAGYELAAVLCVLIFRQHPDQWPPSFGSPWRATSLREFWSRSWHQWLRRTFTFLGYPLLLLFGRIGGVIGTFLASGLFHHIVLLAFDPSSEMWRMLLPFGMMGVGVILERAVAGNKTGGWMGWVWTMGWLVLWGNVMADGWTRAGMLGGQPIERLVRTFDEYLHAF